MRTRLLVVTGVDPLAMDSVLMTLAWDLPRTVSVRHRIDPHSQVLSRTVSDVVRVLDRYLRSFAELDHATTRHTNACQAFACQMRDDKANWI